MKKQIIACLVLAGIVTGTSYQAFATPTSDGQKESVETTRSKYNELNSKVNTLESKVMDLTGKMNPLIVATQENDKQIESIQAQSKEIEANIPVLQKEIEEKQKILGQRMRSVYKSGGNTNYLAMLVSSENVGDFISKMNGISKIMKLDNDIISDIETDKAKLDEEVKSLADKKAELVELNKENETKLAEFKKMEAEQKTLIAELDKEIESVNGDLTSLERPLAASLIATINNSSSTAAQIESAVSSLRGLRNQIVSPTVDEEIVQAIEKGKNRVSEINSASQPSRGDSSGTGAGTGSGDTGGVVAPPSGSKADAVVSYAYQFIGKPYVYGATGPNSFDCSGLTQYVFKSVGVSLNRTTEQQVRQGVAVSRDQLQKGDLVFTEGSATSPTHVGIYIGNGQMIHAPRPGSSVKVAPMYKFVTARRVL